MREKSKIDPWVSIVFWAAAAAIVISLFFIPPDERLIGIIVGVPLLAIILWIYFGSYFELRDSYLYCRCGPFFEKIKYENIKTVRRCRNFLSSMALSRDRIEISQHGKGFITGTTYISPQNIDEFMKELIARCNNLERKIWG
jgi:hypothetical protein